MDEQVGCPDTSNEPEQRALFPEWVESAYRLWVRGQRNWSEIGRQFGVDRRTARDNVGKFARAVVQAADAENIVDAYQATVLGYEEVISAAWQDHAAAKGQGNARAACLKIVQTTTEKLAALRGVVTQRVAIIDETPKPLDDQPLEVLVRIAKNGDGHAEEEH